MKNLFAFILVLALGATLSMAQYQNQSASGSMTVNVARNANVAFLTGPGTDWIVQAQEVTSGWFTFKVSGEATATLKINANISTTSTGISLNDAAAETSLDNFSTAGSSLAVNSPTTFALPGTLAQVPDGEIWVRIKTDYVGVTPSSSNTITATVSLSDYTM